MEYVKLGNTGIDVSRICLGCMSFGIGERGAFPWALDEERSRPMIKKALELGINFFDTANFGRVCHLLNWHSESQQFLQAPYVIS